MSACIQAEATVGGDTAYRCRVTQRTWSQPSDVEARCPACVGRPPRQATELVSAVIERVIRAHPASDPPPTAEALAESATRQAEQAWLERAQRAGVPRRLWAASLGGLDTPALQAVRRYLAEDLPAGRCLVLMGATGTGKSYAAAAALRAAPGWGWRFWYFPALAGAWLDADRRADAMESAKRTPFLVLDDFGTEYLKAGGLVEAFVDELVWHREAEILPTIVTTNLTPDELRARVSDRLVDRWRGAWGRLASVTGPSLRG